MLSLDINLNKPTKDTIVMTIPEMCNILKSCLYNNSLGGNLGDDTSNSNCSDYKEKNATSKKNIPTEQQDPPNAPKKVKRQPHHPSTKQATGLLCGRSDIRHNRGCLAAPIAPGSGSSGVCGRWTLSLISSRDPTGAEGARSVAIVMFCLAAW